MVDDRPAGVGAPLTGPASLNFGGLMRGLNRKGFQARAVDLAWTTKANVLDVGRPPRFSGGNGCRGRVFISPGDALAIWLHRILQ